MLYLVVPHKENKRIQSQIILIKSTFLTHVLGRHLLYRHLCEQIRKRVKILT